MAAKKKIPLQPTPRMTRGRPVRRLYVVRGEGVWHLRQGRTVTDTYATQREAADAARSISKVTGADIFVAERKGCFKVDQSPAADVLRDAWDRLYERHNNGRDGTST
jgi:hypothetical protein